MTQPPLPYVAGPSPAPVSPPAMPQHAYTPTHTTTTYSGSAEYSGPARTVGAEPVVVGATVDLAHELGALRKLQTTTLLLLGVTLVLVLATVVFSGFVAIELWRFLGALQKAFG